MIFFIGKLIQAIEQKNINKQRERAKDSHKKQQNFVIIVTSRTVSHQDASLSQDHAFSE